MKSCHTPLPRLNALCISILSCMTHPSRAEDLTANSLAELAQYGAGQGNAITMPAGTYRLADYLTPEVLASIKAQVPKGAGRPPVPMLQLRGDGNTYDLRGVTWEIDTSLYKLLPGGYTRCILLSGNGNQLQGLTLRNTGPNQGSGGNIFSVLGDGNTLTDVTLHVAGSFPYGYGDLLGKGGPNLVSLQKQSGLMVGGNNNTLRRCKVFSRALGHCFYFQGGDNNRVEDCLAEGAMRSTNEMLQESSGPAYEQNFQSVYLNRDGRHLITPGYTKSLVEDGFRTYGNAGQTSFINCTAINTRAGFEVAGAEGKPPSVIENCVARGTERAYLLGGNLVVRRSRGDIAYGPLLYLRGGQNSDIELELTGPAPVTTVHALATLAGSGHKVRLQGSDGALPNLPIMLGFGMPDHGEMATAILPAPTENVSLTCNLPNALVIQSEQATNCQVDGPVRLVPDAATKTLQRAKGGPWPKGPA